MHDGSGMRTVESDRERISPAEGDEFRRRYDRWSVCSAEALRQERRDISGDRARDRFGRTLLEGMAESRDGDYVRARQVLLRALRQTPRSHSIHFGVRAELVNLLIRLGDTGGAERMVRRTLGRVSFAALDPAKQFGFRAELGRAYRRLGWLSLASGVYRDAARHQVPWSRSWIAIVSNHFHVELRANRLGVARGLLADLEAAASGPEPGFARWMIECSSISMATELGRPEDAAFHLEQARAHLDEREQARCQLLVKNYEADVLLMQRRFAAAAARYREALDAPGTARFSFDLVSSLESGLAASLYRLGEFDPALQEAEMAVRSGARGDRLDELIGLRIQAQCLWALRRYRESREFFLRAEAAHFGREFVREHNRLIAAIEARRALPGWAPSDAGV